MKDTILSIIAAIGLTLFCIGIVWGLMGLLVWSFSSPIDNSSRCRAIAESREAQSATTGWRSDTCYIYKDGTEEVIKL